MNRTYIELGIVICFLFTAVLLLNPFGLWMPPMMHMSILVAFVIFSGAFLALIMREIGGDEREAIHRTYAGRAAFTVGTVILLMGIITQAHGGNVDPWLIYALCGMILAKVAVRVYCAYRK